MRAVRILVLALAGSIVSPLAPRAEGRSGEAALWEGAAGALFPLEKGTPVAVVDEELSFTFVAPPRRGLADPGLAGSCEVAMTATLRNTSDRPVKVTLAVPEIPAGGPAPAPAIRELAFFVDGTRMPGARVDEKGPRVAGAPTFRVLRTLEVAFEPSQVRHIGSLFWMAAPRADDRTLLRFVWGAQSRFGGGVLGGVKLTFFFGDRVRLVPENGRPWDLISPGPPGSRSYFYDDGRNSRLGIIARNMVPAPTLEFAVAPEGPLLAGASPRNIAPGMRPAREMSRPELELALAVYRAAYGQVLRDRTLDGVFEKRPWGPCNPAYVVAHGRKLGAPSIAAFLEANRCQASCTSERARPKDPYGERWQDPLCWYSPVSSMPRSMITDPDIRGKADAIEKLLARTAPKAEKKPSLAGCESVNGTKRACGCTVVGEGRDGGLALALMAAIAACALRRHRS
jgi:hypothetical protein